MQTSTNLVSIARKQENEGVVNDSFEKDVLYSRRDIADILGGGSTQSYFVTKERVVLAGCFGTDLNPLAPEEVYPGFGSNVRSQAKWAAEQVQSFPVFIKRGNKRYEYIGDYRGAGMSFDPQEIDRAERLSDRGPGAEHRISGVLKLQPA